ncbi:TraR/DksA C4-type zinc finger protein [Clostridium ganghwense]|uniref:TraR/DksA C4-type zinc finger protein n=1 Tax=Clostridium ganghwense TaxID=312089 RepID=A0ABT4CMR3_9CLOT|nr:TraR/DksA C4-type zinc finger protein [Clostridium ganghwense]MCY6370342.1 TraR/DksA C4-type zinc finger protein [Clostridium ganghwense]
MDKDKMMNYKNRLIKEKNKVEALLTQMKENEVIDSNSEMSQELSFYDNHPSDTATELFDKEKGIALKKNEMDILNKIDIAIRSVDNGNYGKCRVCGKDITEERLNFIPYTQYCIECKKEQNSKNIDDIYNRPSEEAALGSPFRYKHHRNNVEFDAEDSYQTVENFNKMRKVYDYGDYEYEDEDEVGYVEGVEKISNAQYKQQLPD